MLKITGGAYVVSGRGRGVVGRKEKQISPCHDSWLGMDKNASSLFAFIHVKHPKKKSSSYIS